MLRRLQQAGWGESANPSCLIERLEVDEGSAEGVAFASEMEKLLSELIASVLKLEQGAACQPVLAEYSHPSCCSGI